MSNASSELFRRARERIPGGVNSPVRAFGSVGREPIYIDRALGSRLYSADGREYIDFVCSWGAHIAGHAHPQVVEAVRRAAEKGTSFGACCELEISMAEAIAQLVPSVDRVRMVSSGTEATMSAARLARAFTGREKIIKFSGCYHGHADVFLSKAGSGVMTCGIPGSPGVPRGAAADTLVARYNCLDDVCMLMTGCTDGVAAIIVEPVCGNMGVVLPQDGFLRGLRELCTSHGAVLIFDEVITGFRLGHGGAQARFDVLPDLTTLGKIIGGGLPAAAFGGTKEIMDLLAPNGPVYQAGTLSGNPLALSAGLATLALTREPGFYERLSRRAASFFQDLHDSSLDAGMAATLNAIDSMGCLFCTDAAVVDYDTALRADTGRYAAYFRGMLDRGIYLAPSQFEAMFISAAHSDDDLARALDAHRSVLKELA